MTYVKQISKDTFVEKDLDNSSTFFYVRELPLKFKIICSVFYINVIVAAVIYLYSSSCSLITARGCGVEAFGWMLLISPIGWIIYFFSWAGLGSIFAVLILVLGVVGWVFYIKRRIFGLVVGLIIAGLNTLVCLLLVITNPLYLIMLVFTILFIITIVKSWAYAKN